MWRAAAHLTGRGSIMVSCYQRAPPRHQSVQGLGWCVTAVAVGLACVARALQACGACTPICGGIHYSQCYVTFHSATPSGTSHPAGTISFQCHAGAASNALAEPGAPIVNCARCHSPLAPLGSPCPTPRDASAKRINAGKATTPATPPRTLNATRSCGRESRTPHLDPMDTLGFARTLASPPATNPAAAQLIVRP
jgi:hypothetical protein